MGLTFYDGQSFHSYPVNREQLIQALYRDTINGRQEQVLATLQFSYLSLHQHLSAAQWEQLANMIASRSQTINNRVSTYLNSILPDIRMQERNQITTQNSGHSAVPDDNENDDDMRRVRRRVAP